MLCFYFSCFLLLFIFSFFHHCFLSILLTPLFLPLIPYFFILFHFSYFLTFLYFVLLCFIPLISLSLQFLFLLHTFLPLFQTIYYFIFGEYLTRVLIGGFSLQSTRQQVSSGVLDSSQYSCRS